MAHGHRVRHKRPVSKVRRYWWLAPVLLGVAFILWLATGPQWTSPRVGKGTALDLPHGYISAFGVVAEEYKRYYGKALQDHSMGGQFDQSTRLMKDHSYSMAAQSLEAIAQKASVPSVYNNLGLAYLALNDRGNAVNAFREALARDINYQSVRQNLDRLKDIALDAANPLGHEVEDNNSLESANLIAPGRPVDGEIMAALNDIDCFKVTAPPAPRDILRIELAPKSRTLEPMMKVYGADRGLLDWVKGMGAPGKTVSTTLSPAPNARLFLEVSGYGDSAGLYTLSVTPLKAFDAHEPNDDIFSATPVQLGQDIQANIMDRVDTDYYSFEAGKTGKVKVTIRNRSVTLIPALSTFNPDMRSSGFGPDVRQHGGNLEHTYDVEAGRKYFIQVWSQADSSGEYTLRVEQP
ncbi:MAG: hypothetical protein JST11_24400 [Acidobacteria bacterium]|nr:hypothetical protein [Acidobacteriota bacterium]